MDNLVLTKEQFDALKEMGNIGAGTSATSLSQLLNKKVTISIPDVNLLTVERIADYSFIRNHEDITIAASLRILGSLKGEMLVLFSQYSAASIADILLGRKLQPGKLFNILDSSAIAEVSQILSSSYLNGVGEFLSYHQLIPIINTITIDKMDTLAALLIKNFNSSNFKYLIPIENHLVIEEIELHVTVIFLLEYESVNDILKKVGL